MSEHHTITVVEGRSQTGRMGRSLKFNLVHHEHDEPLIKRGFEFMYCIGVEDGGGNLKGVYFQDREQLKDIIKALQTLYDEGPNKIEAIRYQQAVKSSG